MIKVVTTKAERTAIWTEAMKENELEHETMQTLVRSAIVHEGHQPIAAHLLPFLQNLMRRVEILERQLDAKKTKL